MSLTYKSPLPGEISPGKWRKESNISETNSVVAKHRIEGAVKYCESLKQQITQQVILAEAK